MPATVPLRRFCRLVLSTLGLVLAATAIGAQTPPNPRPATPAPARAPAKPAPQRPATVPAAPTQACEHITLDEAKGLLGADAAASSVPSKGLFTSCGYTNLTGDALTITISDYGLPSVAQQFFEKTREVLKTTTSEDSVGVPAFSYAIAAPVPAGVGAGAASPSAAATAAAPTTAAPPAGAAGGLALLALKDQRTVRLEGVGPFAGRPEQLPKLRAILTRIVSKLTPPVAVPPAGDTPPR